MTDEKITQLFPHRSTHSSQTMAQAAFDTVIMEGGEPEEAEKGSRIPIRVTRLEMKRRKFPAVPLPRQRLGLLRLREVPVSFYKYLFRETGEGHFWQLPPAQTDSELHDMLNGPETEVHVLYAGGAPAGFFELSLAKPTEAVVMNCFGLLPHARGRGIGRWFLAEAVRAGFEHDTPRLRLQTNNLDSPIALQLYQQAGFEVVGATNGHLVWDGDR